MVSGINIYSFLHGRAAAWARVRECDSVRPDVCGWRRRPPGRVTGLTISTCGREITVPWKRGNAIDWWSANFPNNYNKLCAWRHNMPLPLQVDNIFIFIRQVAPVPACWLFKTSASWPLTFWPWKLWDPLASVY